jgi:hypothetical protein
MGVGGQRHAPSAFTPGKEPVPNEYKTGWAAGLAWTSEENLASKGFDLPTFQLVASHYIDCTIPTNVLFIYTPKLVYLSLWSIVLSVYRLLRH